MFVQTSLSTCFNKNLRDPLEFSVQIMFVHKSVSTWLKREHKRVSPFLLLGGVIFRRVFPVARITVPEKDWSEVPWPQRPLYLAFTCIETMETQESLVSYILQTAGLGNEAIAKLKKAGLTTVARLWRHNVSLWRQRRATVVNPAFFNFAIASRWISNQLERILYLEDSPIILWRKTACTNGCNTRGLWCSN